MLTKEMLEQESVRKFLELINNSYNNFERDKKISDHAFSVSEKEYQELRCISATRTRSAYSLS